MGHGDEKFEKQNISQIFTLCCPFLLLNKSIKVNEKCLLHYTWLITCHFFHCQMKKFVKSSGSIDSPRENTMNFSSMEF